MAPTWTVPLSRAQKRVLYFLTDNATTDNDGERSIVVRRKQIMDATGVSERMVPYTLRKLEIKGLITTVRQTRLDGSFDANKYIIHRLDGRADLV